MKVLYECEADISTACIHILDCTTLVCIVLEYGLPAATLITKLACCMSIIIYVYVPVRVLASAQPPAPVTPCQFMVLSYTQKTSKIALIFFFFSLLVSILRIAYILDEKFVPLSAGYLQVNCHFSSSYKTPKKERKKKKKKTSDFMEFIYRQSNISSC